MLKIVLVVALAALAQAEIFDRPCRTVEGVKIWITSKLWILTSKFELKSQNLKFNISNLKNQFLSQFF